MSGNWNHIVKEDGTPYEGKYGMGDLLETGGDITEFAEEVYGMVWSLAISSVVRLTGRPATRAEVLEQIERARATWKTGMSLGRSMT